MKKLYALMGAVALTGMAFSAQAQTEALPDATIVSGIDGKYMCSEYGVQNIELQYMVDGEAVEIKFVDAKIGYPEWDETKENPYEYVDLTMSYPSEDQTATMTVKGKISSMGGGWLPGPWSTRDAGTETGNSLQITLDEVNFVWPAGEYSITIPAETVVEAEGELKNGQQIISWTMLSEFAYIQDYEIDPRPADSSEGVDGIYTQAQMAEVVFTFPEGEELVYNAGEITYTIEGDYDSESTVLAEEYYTLEDNILTLKLGHLDQGSYNFDIPSGFMTVGDKLFGGKYLSYTIWNGLPAGEVLDGPSALGLYARNIEVYYGQEVFIVENGPKVNVYEGWYDENTEPYMTLPAENVKIVTMVYGEGGGVPDTGDDTESENSGTEISVLYLDIEELLNGKLGDFIVVIPEGLVANEDGQVNPLKEISFTLTQLVEAEPTIETEDGVICLAWEGLSYASNNEGTQPARILSEEGVSTELSFNLYGWEGWGEISYDDVNNVVKVDLNELGELENGNYELIIPEGYLTLSFEDDSLNGINKSIVYVFTYEDGQTSGVKALESSAINHVNGVYNLQGVKVANDASNLPAGLYVIDGKKVLIRK